MLKSFLLFNYKGVKDVTGIGKIIVQKPHTEVELKVEYKIGRKKRKKIELSHANNLYFKQFIFENRFI